MANMLDNMAQEDQPAQPRQRIGVGLLGVGALLFLGGFVAGALVMIFNTEIEVTLSVVPQEQQIIIDDTFLQPSVEEQEIDETVRSQLLELAMQNYLESVRAMPEHEQPALLREELVQVESSEYVPDQNRRHEP